MTQHQTINSKQIISETDMKINCARLTDFCLLIQICFEYAAGGIVLGSRDKLHFMVAIAIEFAVDLLAYCAVEGSDIHGQNPCLGAL
jgi:hypothetical protein